MHAPPPLGSADELEGRIELNHLTPYLLIEVLVGTPADWRGHRGCRQASSSHDR
jgi:hypothetical protein